MSNYHFRGLIESLAHDGEVPVDTLLRCLESGELTPEKILKCRNVGKKFVAELFWLLGLEEERKFISRSKRARTAL